jgi:hypothetical protein
LSFLKTSGNGFGMAATAGEFVQATSGQLTAMLAPLLLFTHLYGIFIGQNTLIPMAIWCLKICKWYGGVVL